jgi:hypothetical protein
MRCQWLFEGVQEFRSSGVQEFRSSGVQEFRSSGVQEFRSSAWVCNENTRQKHASAKLIWKLPGGMHSGS